MSRFADYLKRSFRRTQKPLRYKEIFSTTESVKNTQNTNPLEIDDELDFTSSKIDSAHTTSSFVSFVNRRTKILQQEIFDSCPEYNGPIYAHAVKDSLKRDIKAIKKELFSLVLIFILSIGIDVFAQFYSASLRVPFVSISSIYLIFSTLLLIASFILGYKTIKKACGHIVKAVFSLDTAIVFPAIITTFNCCVSLVLSFLQINFQQHTFVSIFLLNFILIDATFLLNKRRVFNNLRFIVSSKQKYNVEVSSLGNMTSKDKSKKNIFTAYQHKTDFLANFIQNSNKESIFDKLIAILISVSVVFSALCGVVNFIITKNIVLSLAAFNISSLLLLPAALPFFASSIISSLCKFALKNKSLIVGEDGLKKLAKAKSVVINDSDLYPQNNVVLRGIKTFSGQRVDEAILLATAIVCRLKAPISHVFEKIILGKKAVLTKASNVKYVDGKGVAGWVNSQRILVGNRELLKEYKISPPSHDYEEKYKIPNCELTYLAVGRELVAMFILEYLPSKSLYSVVRLCVKNNVKIFIKSVDCNITLQKISQDFGLRKKYVKIVSNKEKNHIDEACKKTTSKSESCVSTLGSCSSLIKTLCASSDANNRLWLSVAVQCLQLIANLFLIFNIEISELHSLEWLMYVCLWLTFTFLTCSFKNLFQAKKCF